MPTLEVSALEVRYGGIEAVKKVTLSVDQGEVLAVLGANGAGKSSTLRAVSGLIRSSGTVSWNGQDISRWPAYRRARAGLTLVPEGRRVFATLNVAENLLIGGYSQRSRSKRDKTLSTVYDMFPRLADRRTSAAGLLSGGEQQMLAFGRAMMAEPSVILMDEPSMGLAPTLVDQVLLAAAEIAKTGVGILMVEQNAVAALEVADRAAVLERGAVVLQGTAAELSQDPMVLRAFLGAEAVPVKAEPEVLQAGSVNPK
jgi:branched-chain amino acid transport system ATP-binding protein